MNLTQPCFSRVIFLLASLLLVGCVGTATLTPLMEPPSDMPPAVRACTAGESQLDCLRALSIAVELGDTVNAGQVMLARAADVPKSGRGDAIRGALWLNNSPWIPEALLPTFELQEDLDVPVLKLSPNALIFFGAAEGISPPSGSHLAETPMTRVALEISALEHPLGGDSLASKLAAANGAVAAAWTPGGQARVVPAAPLFERLLGFSVAGLVDDGEVAAWDAAILVGQADLLARRGQLLEAQGLLAEALVLLPKSAAPCSTRGAILFVKDNLGSSMLNDDSEELRVDLDTTCLNAELQGQEALTRDYLAHLIQLNQYAISAGAPASSPVEWLDAVEREAYLTDLTALAAQLDGRRAAILLALGEVVRNAASRPASLCDTDFDDRKAGALQTLSAQLVSLGHDRWLIYDVAAALVNDEGWVKREEVARYMVWVDRPENAWFRRQALVSGLERARTSTWLSADRRAIAPLCDALVADLLRDVQVDTGEESIGRNAERLFEAYRFRPACGPNPQLDVLFDEVFASAERTGSGEPEWVLAHMMTQLGVGILQSQVDLPKVLTSLVDGLERVRTRLTESPEDQAVSSVLLVTIRAAQFMLGGDQGVEIALNGAILRLEPLVLVEVGEDSPEIVKVAPGLQLGAYALLAAFQALNERTDDVMATLATLESVLPRNTQKLLENTGASAHVDAVVALVGAVPALVRALANPTAETLAAARVAVERADVAGDEETGWWSIGLETARFLAWDVYAFGANGLEDQGAVSEALARAGQVADRALERNLDTFGAKGSLWELLSLLGSAQELGARALASDDDAFTIARALAPEIDTTLRTALARIDPSRFEGAKHEGLQGLLFTLSKTLAEVGLQPILDGDSAAAGRFADDLLAATASIEGPLKAYPLSIAGLIAYRFNPEKGAAAFAEAERALQHSYLDDIAYLPLVMQAAVSFSDEGGHADALAVIDRLGAYGEEGLSCGKAHPVDALLPATAWMLEVEGRHAEADATLNRYHALMESDAKFYGDSQIRCVITSQKGTSISNLDLSQTLANTLLPVSMEGSFQLGMGFTTISKDDERIDCGVSNLGAPRPDFTLVAHLAHAAYAMRAGDRVVAGAQVIAAERDFRLIITGTFGALGAEGALLDVSRERFYGELGLWVTAQAWLQSDPWSARALEEMTRAAISLNPASEALTAEPVVPSYLEGLGFEKLAPVVALLQAAPNLSADGLVARCDTVRAGLDREYWPGLDLLESNLVASYGGDVPRGASLAATVVPPDATWKTSIESWRLLLEAAQGKDIDANAARGLLQSMSASGLDGQALYFARSLSESLLGFDRADRALEVAQAALESTAQDRAPLQYADLVALMLPVWAAYGAQPLAAEGLALSVEVRAGRIPVQEEIQMRSTLLGILAQSGNPMAMKEPISELLGIFLRIAPEDPATRRLLVGKVALEVVNDGVESAEILSDRLDGLLTDLTASGLPDPECKDFLRRLQSTLGDPELAQKACQGYLRWLFLGEPMTP